MVFGICFVTNKIKHFLLNEEGMTIEYLIQVIVIGLGSLSILFGILAALRHQGGVIIEHIDSMGQ